MKHPGGEKGKKRRRHDRQSSSLSPLKMAALLMFLVVDRLFCSVSAWFQSQQTLSRRRLFDGPHIGLRLVNQSAVLEETLDEAAALSLNTAETAHSSVSLSSTEPPPPHWAHPRRHQQTESSPTTTLETSALGAFVVLPPTDFLK